MQSKANIHQQIPKFTKLFPELAPLHVSDKKLGQLAVQMKDEMCNKPENYSQVISNGMAIFSQFLAHDMTFESSSQLKGTSNNISQFQNDRSINLDLDCVYGQKTQSFFYDATDTDKLLLGKYHEKDGDCWYDLQRNAQHKAIIPDARNDENIIVSQMQVLFIQFHNKMVDHLRETTDEKYVFAKAKQQVIWHYHWLIIYGYLHKMMDWDIFTSMLNEDSQYYTEPSSLPLEFSGAAFRAGHSQTRDINRINEKVNKNLFDLGFFGLMEEYVDWRYIFNFKDGRCELARLIDTKIGPSFHDIPFIQSDNPLDRSLPFLNLKRGVVYGLPSGEDVARRMGFDPIDIPETKNLDLKGTPLWFYILREAEVLGHGGEHLGPVGSTLLGECFFTIMRQDDWSYLKLYRKWTPTLGKKKCEFDFEDLINFVNL